MYTNNTKEQLTETDRELSVINTLFPRLTREQQQLIFCSLNAAFIAAQLPQKVPINDNIVEIKIGRTTKRRR